MVNETEIKQSDTTIFQHKFRNLPNCKIKLKTYIRLFSKIIYIFKRVIHLDKFKYKKEYFVYYCGTPFKDKRLIFTEGTVTYEHRH